MLLAVVLIIVVAFMIAALPLHLAVKLLGGKSNIFKAILVNIIVGLVTAGIYGLLPYASIISMIALVWIYREMFRLKWFKAFLAWIVQITLTFVFILIFAILFGVSLFV